MMRYLTGLASAFLGYIVLYSAVVLATAPPGGAKPQVVLAVIVGPTVVLVHKVLGRRPPGEFVFGLLPHTLASAGFSVWIVRGRPVRRQSMPAHV